MAEESGDLPMTPEITKPNEGNSRRNSMGKASFSNSGEKVLPRYLRASTGSCHDFCKYGRKHASEAKERRPIQKRIIKPAPDSQSPTVTVTVPERKKTSVVKSDPSPFLKSSLDIPEAEIIKQEVSTKSPYVQNVTATSGGQNPVNSEGHSGMKKTAAANLRTSLRPKTRLSEAEIIKREVSTKSPYVQNVNATSGGQNPVNSEVDSGMKKTAAAILRTSPRPKTRLSESPKFNRQEVSSSSEKVNVSSRTVSSKSKETNASSMKLKSPVKRPLSLPDHLGGLSGGRNSDINSGKKMGQPKVAVKKPLTSLRLSLPSPKASFSPNSSNIAVKKAPASPRLPLASPRVSLSPKPSICRIASLNSRKHKSVKVVSPLKNQGKVKNAETEQSKNELKQANNNDLVHEKTLYVIKMETENKSLESDHSASCATELSPSPSSLLPKCIPTSPSSLLQNEEDKEQSEYTETEAEDDYLSESEYEESMSVDGEESLGGEHQGKPKKYGMVHSEDKDSEAMKLHFRRGKIVDIQSESNCPRRLKFRRGRVLGQNQNLKADSRRSFKKRGVDDEMNSTKPRSQKVVLRHQDVQGKKDSQVLFNNVIEQTASKLVETRKSKVKALVGAFETVISLQESKPSANVLT
ncbi:uncharacterized protein LOC102619126 isoform X3 [Citrus sinensis]|uniref:uncharacterized protein LOC102619126 isoform X3 n=1 Tax=Citrus sinensis TaxID=2711 RepID=UPI002279216A|nr:uncharacterized protein LOC102619126 isoform X3 [Citrus sinensis]